MARRKPASDNSKSATATAERPNEVQEDTVSTTVTEAPVADEVEATVTESAPESHDEKHEAEIDLTEFSQAIESAVNDTESRDKDTGDLPPTLLEPVNVAFRKLEGAKAKNKARAHLNGLMKDAMNALDMPLARSYMILSDGLSAAGGSAKSERTPADPTEAFVQKVAGLHLASKLAEENVPEGVDEGWKDKVNELYTESLESAHSYLAYLSTDEDERDGEEPEVTAVVKAAVKLAQGKSAKVGGGSRGTGTPHEGPRRDIGKHIQEAFAGVEEGTFLTIAEIRKHVSEEYGDNPPSAGAISARLFPSNGGKCTVEGIVPDTNESGKKGARKV